MKLFTGLAGVVASLSGDVLCSISWPSRDPAAGVIEQTWMHALAFLSFLSLSLSATVMRQRKQRRGLKSVFEGRKHWIK